MIVKKCGNVKHIKTGMKDKQVIKIDIRRGSVEDIRRRVATQGFHPPPLTVVSTKSV